VVAKGPASVDFDLACFFTGDVATAEAAEDGEVADDAFYIRNQNPTIRTVPVESSAMAYEIDAAGEIHFVPVPFAGWPADPSGYTLCPSEFCTVWLYVNGGSVTEILEQYLP
jgi:hypothetical protein